MAKSVKFESNAEGPITVAIPASGKQIQFTPGEVRTYETSDPIEIESLSQNPDLSVVKGEGKKKS